MPGTFSRRVAALAAFSVLFSLVPLIVVQPAQASRAATGCPIASPYASGDGSALDPFEIETDAQLQYLWENRSDWDDSFSLKANIDLTGCIWSAGIGDMTDKFEGTFDGSGFVISGLSVNESSITAPSIYTGLFGVIGASGLIEDVRLLGVTVMAEGWKQEVFAGAIAGRSEGIIRDVEVRQRQVADVSVGSVTASAIGSTEVSATAIAGGVVGMATSPGSVSNSISDVTVLSRGGLDPSASTYAGGVIGILETTALGQSLQASGSVSAEYGNAVAGGAVGYTSASLVEVSSDANVWIRGRTSPLAQAVGGGVVGQAMGFGSITNAYGIGFVNGAGSEVRVGGIVGRSEFSIAEAWSEMAVQAISNGANQEAFAGGISGDQQGGSITNSFSRSGVTAETQGIGSQAYAGGIVGRIGNFSMSNVGTLGGVNGRAYDGEAFAGGVVGMNFAAISNSYSAAFVDAQQGDPAALTSGKIGGFAGLNQAYGNVVDSFWNQELVADGLGSGSVGVTDLEGLTTSEGTSLTPYQDAGWSISNGYNNAFTWNWCPRINFSYPLNSFRFSPNECGTIAPASQNVEGVTTRPVTPTAPYVPEYLNAGPVTYSITPTLPTGLSFDTSTGIVSGTPSETAPPTVHTVTATDGTSNAEATINLRVVAASLSPASQTVTGQKNSAITPTQTVTATNFAAAPTYSIAPALPTGLTMDTNTGVISGTPTAPHPATVHTLTGQSGGQAATASVTITISDNTPTPDPIPPMPDPPPTPSPSPTPTPSPTPSPPGPEPAPVLKPGQVTLSLGGQPQPVTSQPVPGDRGLALSGNGFEVVLMGFDANDQPLALSPQGALVLQQGQPLQASGDGYQPNAALGLYMNPPTGTRPVSVTRSSAPTLLGTVTASSSGAFSTSVVLPEGVPVGDHILQLVGLSPSGSIRALSIGIRVSPPASITLIKGNRVSNSGRIDTVTATGTTIGVAPGQRLTPYVRVGPRGDLMQGTASVEVGTDGTFTYTRDVRADRQLAVYLAWTDTRSNTIAWKRIR